MSNLAYLTIAFISAGSSMESDHEMTASYSGQEPQTPGQSSSPQADPKNDISTTGTVKKATPESMELDLLYSPSAGSGKGELPPESILSASNSSTSSSSSSSSSSDSENSSSGSESSGTKRKIKKALAKIFSKKSKKKSAKKEKPKKAKKIPKNTSTTKHVISPDPNKTKPTRKLDDPPTLDTPPQYIENREKRHATYELCNIFGGEVAVEPPGSFRNGDDDRPLLTREAYLTAKNTNLSYTYNYGDLQCRACHNSHPLLGRDVKPVFILADQNFPAALPVNDGGKCIGIHRIEDASLEELAESFIAKTRCGWLPPGTTILLSAPGYLSWTGLAAYTEELASVASRIRKAIPHTCNIYHAPVTLLAGTNDPALIRALAELAHWLLSTQHIEPEDALPQTTEAWLAHITKIDDEEQPNYPIRFELPESVNNNSTRKKVWHSHPTTPLPKTVAPIISEEEEHIIKTLITEINGKYRSGLSLDVSMNRASVQPQKAMPNAVEHLVIIGGIHAAGIADAARTENIKTTTIDISTEGKTPKTEIIRKIEQAGRAASMDGETVMFVYQLFDGCTFRDQNNRLPARGTHIRGPVKVAEKKEIEEAVEAAAPLITAAGNHGKAILGPLPKYAVKPCCADPAHCTNCGTAAYREKIKKDLNDAANTIRESLGNNGIRRHRVLTASNTVLEAPPEEVWGSDPIIPSKKSYRAILSSVLTQAGSILSKKSANIPATKRLRSETDPREEQRHPQDRQRWQDPYRGYSETERTREYGRDTRYPHSDHSQYRRRSHRSPDTESSHSSRY